MNFDIVSPGEILLLDELDVGERICICLSNEKNLTCFWGI